MVGELGKPACTEDIFHAAFVLPAQKRPAYLDVACGADAQLRNRVEALLRVHDAPEGFLPEEPAISPVGTNISGLIVPLAEQAGDFIGRYKLLKKIGEGGCGV